MKTKDGYQLCAQSSEKNFFPFVSPSYAQIMDLCNPYIEYEVTHNPELEIHLLRFTKDQILEIVSKDTLEARKRHHGH